MLWGDKKKVTLQLHVNAPSGKTFYTNNDNITGTVSVHSTHKIPLKSLKVVFYGLCTTSLPDALACSTFYKAEKHYSVKTEDVLVALVQPINKIEATLPAGNNVFKFNIRVPSYDLLLPCCTLSKKCHLGIFPGEGANVGLPPSFKYKGVRSTIDIQYCVRAFMERDGSKPNLVDSQEVTFLPTSLFTSFNIGHTKFFRESIRECCINYIFKLLYRPKTPELADSQPHSNDTTRNSANGSSKAVKFIKSSSLKPPSSGNSSPTDSLYRSDSFSSYASSQSSIMLKNRGSVRDFFTNRQKEKFEYQVPITVSVTFYQNVTRNFDDKGVLKHKGALAQHMRIFLNSPVSPFDLFKDVIDVSKDAEESEQLESLDKFALTSLSINLASLTNSRSPDSINSESGNTELLNLRKIIYDIDLLSFNKITKECRTIYQYELDPNVFNCPVNSEIPSFKFCNAERDYQIQIEGDLYWAGNKTSKKFNINTDVVILS